MKTTTLCYIENNDRYLMMHRITKENDVNTGKWIGVGGKVKQGESVDECLIREVFEETGIALTAYSKRGVIDFISDIYPEEIMHLYTASVETDFFESKTDEGVLEWIPVSEITDLPIWEGDKIFLDLLIRNSPPFLLTLIYQSDNLISSNIQFVESLP